MAVREIVARVLQEVVPVRAEVVVDDIENHAEAARVRRIDEPREAVGASVAARRREEVDAVVAPVSVSGELGDRHQLDRRYPELAQVVELADQRVERALRRVRPDVHLVDHEAAR